MQWSDTMSNQSFDQRAELIGIWMNDVLVPCLSWRGGRNAESIRTIAAQTLSAMVQGAPNECTVALPTHATLLNALIDDNNAITRAYSMRALMKCGPVPPESYEKLIMSE